MPRTIFPNVPVRDVEKTRAFWTQLGFAFDERFCDENAVCMIVNDGASVMLLQYEFFKTRTELPGPRRPPLGGLPHGRGGVGGDDPLGAVTASERVTLALVTLVHDGTLVPLGRLLGRAPDLTVIDALARLQLAAGRARCSIRLRAVCPDLVELVDLAGLASLLDGRSRSALEARRQTEAGEQLDVEEGEEVVDGGDLDG